MDLVFFSHVSKNFQEFLTPYALLIWPAKILIYAALIFFSFRKQQSARKCIGYSILRVGLGVGIELGLVLALNAMSVETDVFWPLFPFVSLVSWAIIYQVVQRGLGGGGQFSFVRFVSYGFVISLLLNLISAFPIVQHVTHGRGFGC